MTTTLSLLMLLCCSQAPDDVQSLLESKAYQVVWNNPDIPDPQTTLEVGSGNGHGGTLHWLRFQPGQVHVEVLAITYDESRVRYQSKWPPDRAELKVQRGLITKDAYSSLLSKIGWLQAAKIEPRKQQTATTSSADFWVSVYGVWKSVPVIDHDWAGYSNSNDERRYAVPRAIAALAARSIKSANAKDYELTAADRSWASRRFNRDWQKFDKSKTHWWVRNRYLSMIGLLGDKSVYPTLSKVLREHDPNQKPGQFAVYYAINAATRLTKTDVRTQPVEEMDLKENAAKVLEVLKDK